ncbi:hypothetical protein [Rhodococcus rhodochrous]|uniref:hypothetical protein n=1 Tax=Rhodococcus rhodochrous TaxID=1829 RepID=UPI0017818A2E|nr:hypothetical protein [Rhodococcus rhodochrous]QOH59914.1 hypothetical protein C6Y44_27890 [Rhodococcus rhodochrous]
MTDPKTQPSGVSLDLVERVRDEDAVHLRRIGVVKPNTIRLNGQAVLIPRDQSIEITSDPDSAVIARLSMFVADLNVGFEATGPMTDDERTLRADLLRQVTEGRQLIVRADEHVRMRPIWEGRAYDTADLMRLRNEIDAILTEGGDQT